MTWTLSSKQVVKMAMKQALELVRVKNHMMTQQELIPLKEARIMRQSTGDEVRTSCTSSKTSSSNNKIIKYLTTC
jgi:hypothetical protein